MRSRCCHLLLRGLLLVGAGSFPVSSQSMDSLYLSPDSALITTDSSLLFTATARTHIDSLWHDVTFDTSTVWGTNARGVAFDSNGGWFNPDTIGSFLVWASNPFSADTVLVRVEHGAMQNMLVTAAYTDIPVATTLQLRAMAFDAHACSWDVTDSAFTVWGTDDTSALPLTRGRYTSGQAGTHRIWVISAGRGDTIQIIVTRTDTSAVSKLPVSTTTSYVSINTGVVLSVLDLTGSDSVSVALQTNAYPPDVSLLRHPLPRYYTIEPGPGITSIRTALTLPYTQTDFTASELTSEQFLFCVRYHDGQWDTLASIVDTFKNTVTCTTAGFSVWAIDGVCRGIDCHTCTVRYLTEPPAQAYTGVPYMYPVQVTGGTVRQLLAGPVSMELKDDTVRWVPGIQDTGSHQVKIWANGFCAGAVQEFSLLVEVPTGVFVVQPVRSGGTTMDPRPDYSIEARIHLRVSERISLRLFSVQGKAVSHLPAMIYTAGTHTIGISAACASGIYLLQIQGETFSETRKIIITR
jgi:hypothetical protein